MDLQKWLKRNPVSAMFLGGIALSLALSQGNIRQNADAIGNVRSIAQQNAASQMELQATEQSAQQRAKIAVSRYQSGCVMVVASNAPNQFTTLSEGQPVLDAVRRSPLPVGSVVCDALGNSAVIAPGANGQPVATQMAFTGDRAIVKAAMDRINAQYNAPRQ